VSTSEKRLRTLEQDLELFKRAVNTKASQGAPTPELGPAHENIARAESRLRMAKDDLGRGDEVKARACLDIAFNQLAQGWSTIRKIGGTK
jgi:hypothetical protein